MSDLFPQKVAPFHQKGRTYFSSPCRCGRRPVSAVYKVEFVRRLVVMQGIDSSPGEVRHRNRRAGHLHQRTGIAVHAYQDRQRRVRARRYRFPEVEEEATHVVALVKGVVR